MPGENIQDWSTTALTNGAADSSIGWAEGQTRASVNNSARSMMAAVAKQRNLWNGSITTTGTANAQAFTSGVTYTSVPTGLWVRLKIGAALTNTASATLNMDSIGAVVINDQNGFTLAAGALIAGTYCDFLYNGSVWVLLNPDSVGRPAWTAWVPVITASFGTITTSSTAVARYIRIGQAITAYFDIGIGDAGTAVGAAFLNVTLPTAVIPISNGTVYGKEINLTAAMVVGTITGSSVGLAKYDGTSIVTTGARLQCTATYEANV